MLAAIQEFSRVLATDPRAPQAGDAGGCVYFDLWGRLMVRGWAGMTATPCLPGSLPACAAGFFSCCNCGLRLCCSCMHRKAHALCECEPLCRPGLFCCR